MARKYLSLDRLTEYDALIKGKINEGDEGVKSYVDAEIAKMASSSHTHDDRYYTETEIDDKLSTINTSISNITSGTAVVKNAEHATSADSATTATKATQDGDGKVIANTYETKDDANAKLQEVKEYADTKVSGLASTSSVESAISTHNTSSDAHSDIRETLAAVKEDVDAFFKDATLSEEAKDTLKEIQDYITGDASAAAEMTASIANKADKVHTHAISDVSGLQDTLDSNNEAIAELTETIENVKEDAANQTVIVLAEAQKGIDANTDRIEVLETLVSNKVDTEHTHSWDDLEDRPFYYNKKVLLNITSENTHYNSDTETIDLVVGEKYNVLFKDMLFRDMVCKEDDDGFRYLQDPNFFYIDDRGGAGLQISGGVYSSYTIEVYQEEIKKLDDLFLEQSDWNNNDEYSGVYIKNRPFYSVEPVYEVVSDEITVDVNTAWYGNNYYVKMTPGLGEKFRLSFQDVCTIVWDGIEYKDIQVQFFESGRYPMTAIGNNCYETPLFTTYPFSIGYTYNNFNTELWVCAREAGTHTFQIFLQTVKPELKQLDEKYIPDSIARVEDLNNIDFSSYQSKEDDNLTTTEKTVIGAINEVNEKASTQSDWNENDETSSKFIKNRTHYALLNKDYNLEQTKFALTNPGSNGGYFESLSIPLLKPLTIGTEYIVVWDGVQYPITITSTGSMGSLYWSGAPIEVHSGEPFFVGFGVDNGNSIIAIIMGEGQGDHTIEIYTGQEEVVQLDEKFIPNISIDKLPDISWNNLTDKPFYENISGDVLLEEQDINLSNKSGNGYNTSISIVLTVTEGNEYAVIWDGIPYKVIATTNTLGNMYWTGPSNNTGEPFFIGFDTSEIDIFAETQGKHTLAIYSNYNCEVKQLDEKYIPDTNWNNLLDRPFYENISGDILLEEQTVNCSESTGNGYSVYINASLAVTEGNEYTVIWDGIPYKVIAETNSLGNMYWNGSSTNTGEPFFIGASGSRLYIATENQEEHTFEVYSDYNYELKQLDEKFIPDISIDKLPDISWNNLSDKPFYESITGDILLEEQTVNCSDPYGNGYCTMISRVLSITEGTEYTIIWDGVPYKVIARTSGSSNSNDLGNKYIYNGVYGNTGEPFFIGVDGSSFHIYCAEQGEHTLEVYSNYNYEVKQLDEKFIPNINWEKISNKPFYESISGDVLLEEQVINFTSDRIFKELSFIDNTIYTVIWDGVKYECLKEEGKSYIGNFSIVVPSSPDTGEPFFIDTPSIYCKTQGEHVVAIYSDYNCEVKKLDEKFIPDISWNNLKDKPFYENISGDVLLEKQIVNCSESTANGYSTNINASLTVIEGNEYTVIWDGVPYTLTAVGTTLGNIYWNGSSTNTGEPFFIGVSSFSVNTLYIATENQEEHTLEVYSNYNYEVKQLDEKYIPDNIRGVGKSTTGTVYTINNTEVTAKEGAEIFNSYSNNIASGLYSHAEGYYGKASGDYSHAEGHSTKAEGYISHAEGFATYATGSWSHAEGHSSVASGITSHAEGGSSTASGHTSHAEGNGTTASGDFSHAEGNGATASGDYSHAEGKDTIASGENQHVQGKYNIEDTENKYAHIVGNGKTNKSRSNAHTVDWDGNAWYKGDLFVGGTSQDEGSKLVTESEVDVKLQDKANATHTHAISDITDLETTLANAASAISANTNSISANSNAISSLQAIVNDIQEISSEEIQALFA